MRKESFKRFWWVFLLAAAAIVGVVIFALSTSHGGKYDPEEDARIRERIFTKTIRDFEGYPVDNLDEDEAHNFIVYQKGVHILSAENGKALVSADMQNLVYVFENASPELKELKEGDVFFVRSAGRGTSPISGKVKEIEISGDSLTLTGDAEVGVEDLIEYADVNMDIPVADLWYDESELDEDVTVTLGPLEGDEFNSAPVSVGTMAAPKQLTARAPEAAASRLASVDIPIGLTLSSPVTLTSFSGSKRSNLTGSNSLTIVKVHAEFYYSLEDLYCYAAAWADTRVNTDLTLDLEFTGTPWEKSFPILEAPIGTGPVMIQSYAKASLEVAGGMRGGVHSQLDRTSGFGGSISKSGVNLQPVHSSSMSNSADLELEGSIDLTVALRFGLGVPGIASIYVEAGLGPELTGELDLISAEQEDSPDSIHDCKKCIDGDILMVGKVTAGAMRGFLFRLLKLPIGAEWKADLLTVESKINDFYLSYRPGNDDVIDAGMGECPHKRWKVDVLVYDIEGKLASGGTVNAVFPNGLSDSATISDGSAVIYLPDGSNQLKAVSGRGTATADVAIDGAPSSLTMQLEKSPRKLLVSSDFYDVTQVPELASLIEEKYTEDSDPAAELVFIPTAGWNGSVDPITEFDIQAGDILLYFTLYLEDTEPSYYINSSPDPAWPSWDAVYEAAGMERAMAHIFIFLDDPSSGREPELRSVCAYDLIAGIMDGWGSRGYGPFYPPADNGEIYYTQQGEFGADYRYYDCTYDSSYNLTSDNTSVEIFAEKVSEPGPYFATGRDRVAGAGETTRQMAKFLTQYTFPVIDLLLNEEWNDFISSYK